MYEQNIKRLPTDAAAHIICIAAGILLIIISALLTAPVRESSTALINIPVPETWYTSTWGVTLNTAIILLTTLIIAGITNRYAITSSYSILPTLFYLMYQCCNPMTGRVLQQGNIGALAIIISTSILFGNYQNKNSAGNIYGATLLLALTSLLWGRALFYIPLLWIGMMQMHIFNLQTFSASLLAILTILWIYTFLLIAGIIPGLDTLTAELLKNLVPGGYMTLDISEQYGLIYLLPAIIILAAMAINTLYRETHDKISVRSYNRHLNTTAVFTLLYIAADPDGIFNYMPVFNSVAAIQAARYFDTIKSLKKLRMLYATIIIYLSMYIIWIL